MGHGIKHVCDCGSFGSGAWGRFNPISLFGILFLEDVPAEVQMQLRVFPRGGNDVSQTKPASVWSHPMGN